MRRPASSVPVDPDSYALDLQLARSLKPIAFVLAAMWASSVVHRALDPELAAITAPTAIVPTVAFLVLGLLITWRPMPPQLANAVMLCSLGLIAVESLGRGQEIAGVNLHWELIGLGAVVLRVRWGFGCAAAVVVPWLVVSAAGLNGWSLTSFGFALDMVTASALGTVVFVARRRAVVGLVAARRDLQRLALTDPLTGLRNRRGVEHAVGALLEAEPGRLLDILYLDLDGFKQVNDRYGHAEGDRALIGVASVLRQTFRDGDVLGRVGGDEFVVIVSPTLDTAAAAERLRERLAAWHDEASRIGLSASLGTGRMERPALDALWVAIDAADQRMYADKQARRKTRAAAAAREVAASLLAEQHAAHASPHVDLAAAS